MKACTRQQLANLFGVDRKTFYRWLVKRNIEIPTGLISPKDQEIIFEKLGYPTEKEPSEKKEKNRFF